MLDKLLHQASDLEVILTLAAMFLSSGLLFFWIAFYPRFTKTLDHIVGVNQTLYGPVTTLFTFTAAFLGASVWGHFQAAQNAVGNERTALNGYYLVVHTNPYLKSSVLEQKLVAYVSSAMTDEWETIAVAGRSSKTIKLFSDLYQASMEAAQHPELNPVVAGALVRSVETLRTMRDVRLGLRYQGFESTRWYAILFLAIFAQMTIMITHLYHRKKAPMAVALAVVTVLVFSITSLIAMSVNPYTGVIQVSKVPLEGVIGRIQALQSQP